MVERILTAGTTERCDLGTVVQKYCGVYLDKSIRNSFMGHSGALNEVQKRYAMDDVRYLIDVQEQQEKALAERGMTETANLENDLVPVVADMELAGIGFNPSAWDSIMKEEERILPEMEQRLQKQLSPSFAYDMFS